MNGPNAPPFRVMHVITRLILGGAQENTLFTVEGLQQIPDYRVTLLTGPALGPEGELVARARRNLHDFRILPDLRREIDLHRDRRSLETLSRIFRRERPHVVHTHSTKAGILGRLAARCAAVPVIIHTIHGQAFHPNQARAANVFYIALERMAARWSDKIISVADVMTDQAVAAAVAPRGRFITIYSGMEVAPFLADDGARARVRREFGIADDELVIGKIARLFELKGHEDVLRAMPRVLAREPRVRLLFVGDGVLREHLQRVAAELGIAGRVIFAGLVDPARIPAMIKAMDVVVHASLREGLARVLPQALLSGCPTVSYDIDGAREVVIPGETGFLVPPRSVDGLAEALIAALTDLPAARRMAAEGRRRFTDRFRSETMVRRIDALYRDLLAHKLR